MRKFQDTFETRKRSFNSAFSICVTVPLATFRPPHTRQKLFLTITDTSYEISIQMRFYLIEFQLTYSFCGPLFCLFYARSRAHVPYEISALKTLSYRVWFSLLFLRASLPWWSHVRGRTHVPWWTWEPSRRISSPTTLIHMLRRQIVRPNQCAMTWWHSVWVGWMLRWSRWSVWSRRSLLLHELRTWSKAKFFKEESRQNIHKYNKKIKFLGI